SLASSCLIPHEPPHHCTRSLHDALPISAAGRRAAPPAPGGSFSESPTDPRPCHSPDLSRRSHPSKDLVSGKAADSWVIPKMNPLDRKSTRLNSSHLGISYAVFCLKKKKK